MEKHSIIICILLAIITTNLIRVVPSGIIALVIGIIAAWRRLGLFPVAAICCAIVYLIDTLII